MYIPHVIDKMFLPCEALVAVGAGVRRIAGVLPQVVVEVLFARKRARAVRALVWRFARVLSAQQSTFRFEYKLSFKFVFARTQFRKLYRK